MAARVAPTATNCVRSGSRVKRRLRLVADAATEATEGRLVTSGKYIPERAACGNFISYVPSRDACAAPPPSGWVGTDRRTHPSPPRPDPRRACSYLHADLAESGAWLLYPTNYAPGPKENSFASAPGILRSDASSLECSGERRATAPGCRSIDVPEDPEPTLLSGREALAVRQLLGEAGEEGLGERVVLGGLTTHLRDG